MIEQTIVLAPLIGAAIAGLGQRFIGERSAMGVTTGLVGLACALSIYVFAGLTWFDAPERVVEFFRFIDVAGFTSTWSVRIDPLSGVMLMRALNVVPGGEALGLTGALLAVGVVGNFILGALMTLGLGLYAPCLVMIALLGMSPTTAFPIMMGSCAFLMPIGSLRFVRSGAYNLKAAIGLAIGGIPGVLLAAYIVKSLPARMVAWLVVVIILYAAITMLRAAAKEKVAIAKGASPGVAA